MPAGILPESSLINFTPLDAVWGAFCCQVHPRPRLPELNPTGLNFDHSNCITQPLQPEQCCHLQLLQWPDNGGYHTERKYHLYYMRRSYFAPKKIRHTETNLDMISNNVSIISAHLAKWWRRRVPPPGPLCLFHNTFIAIVDLHRHTNYRMKWDRLKDLS